LSLIKRISAWERNNPRAGWFALAKLQWSEHATKS
jgi:hypothetical protein